MPTEGSTDRTQKNVSCSAEAAQERTESPKEAIFATAKSNIAGERRGGGAGEGVALPTRPNMS